jgi:hypothetical protein
MIHLQCLGPAIWSDYVDHIKILENDKNEVSLCLPKVSLIGLLIEASGIPEAGTNLKFYVSLNGSDWFPYCIIDRKPQNDGSSMVDSLLPLTLHISSSGKFTYGIDLFFDVKFLKIVQQGSGDFNITVFADTIWR